MCLFRRRRYYDDAEIFGSIMTILVLLVFITVCFIYFALITLCVFLAVGVVIGGIYAIIGIMSVLPKVVSDVKAKSYFGGRIVVFMKKFLYFFISIAKFAIVELINRAKKILVKFSAKKIFSFKKWMYLILAISIIVFGIADLAFVWLICASLLFAVIFPPLTLLVLLFAILYVIAFFVMAFVTIKGSFVCVGLYFIPTCYRFARKPPLNELAGIPCRYCRQAGDFINAVWRGCDNFISVLKNRIGIHSAIHPYEMFITTLKINYYIFAPVIIFIETLLSSIVFFIIYLVNTIWILIRSMFK